MSLIDNYGRKIEYLRLSVTDRCNYRCFYCLPPTGNCFVDRDELLHYEEIVRLMRVFTELGVSKVRITGGEPLVRRDLIGLIGELSKLELEDISLSTNGELLQQFAPQLVKSGVGRVNISLDTLKPEAFTEVTRTGKLDRVIDGIDAAIACGMDPVKLNMVVMKGVNDQEIEAMLEFAAEHRVHLRFIETMPLGMHGGKAMDHFYPAEKILKRVRSFYGSDLVPVKGVKGAGPARSYKVASGDQTIGVISAVSRHFCEGCNRVRLTAKGELVLCLGQENQFDLKGVMRAGATDEELKEVIFEAIFRKPKAHDFSSGKIVVSHKMSHLGG